MNTLLYSAAVLWFAGSVGSPGSSKKTPILITARVGSSTVLPCDCSGIMSRDIDFIEWRTSSETVFERSDKGPYQSEGYEDRVDVPEDKLKMGDCSLVLKDVKAEDAGVYESYLLVKGSEQLKKVFIQSVELSVKKTREELIKRTSSAHNDAGIKFSDLRISVLCLLSIILYLH